jgi:hypothetical protein
MWTGSEAPVKVNGEQAASGSPGTYCVLNRIWCDGDVVNLNLPMPLRVTPYSGADRIPGMQRYAVEYGPLLLGVAGNLDLRGKYIGIQADAAQPAGWLLPIANRPGHFTVKGKPGYEYMPYHEIQDQVFTCYPVIG